MKKYTFQSGDKLIQYNDGARLGFDAIKAIQAARPVSSAAQRLYKTIKNVVFNYDITLTLGVINAKQQNARDRESLAQVISYEFDQYITGRGLAAIFPAGLSFDQFKNEYNKTIKG